MEWDGCEEEQAAAETARKGHGNVGTVRGMGIQDWPAKGCGGFNLVV